MIGESIKKAAAFGLILSIVASILYVPLSAKRAYALFGVGDFGFDIEDVVKFALDSIAVPIAQQMVDDMVKSTIDWANTGFEGGPAYVTDPEGFYAESADQAAGQFIEGADLGFLCSPFQRDIRISLQHEYYGPREKNKFQCTFSEALGNIDEFFDGNFERGGGWEAWFAVTQDPVNNPYGGFLKAQIELDSVIAKKTGLEREQLAINQGFKSLKGCMATNPSEDVIRAYESGDYKNPAKQNNLTPALADAYLKADMIARKKLAYDRSKPAGACIKDGPIKTAGATIKSQLDNVLPSGLERLINADQMSDLVGAFASGLLQRYVFGDRGLFGADSVNSGNREMLDIDADSIPDGFSYDGTSLYICHHGLKPKPANISADDWKPSNENCLGSKEAGASPYFTSLCEATGRTLKEIDRYYLFISRNPFKEEYAATWMRNSSAVSGALDQFAGQISRIEAQEYDPLLFNLGKYERAMDKIVETLAKDGDLKSGTGFTRAFGGGKSDKDVQSALIRDTKKIQQYLLRFQQEVIKNRCANPNLEALANIEPPRLELEVGTSTPQSTQDNWLGFYLYQNNLQGSCILKDGVPDVTITPPLETLQGLDTIPTTSSFESQGTTYIDVLFTQNGKTASWQITCSSDTPQ